LLARCRRRAAVSPAHCLTTPACHATCRAGGSVAGLPSAGRRADEYAADHWVGGRAGGDRQRMKLIPRAVRAPLVAALLASTVLATTVLATTVACGSGEQGTAVPAPTKGSISSETVSSPHTPAGPTAPSSATRSSLPSPTPRTSTTPAPSAGGATPGSRSPRRRRARRPARHRHRPASSRATAER